MEETNPNSSIDPNSGFCSKSKIYYCLKPFITLPPETANLSVSEYILNLQTTTSETITALIDTSTGHHVLYSEFVKEVEALAASLRTVVGLSKGDVAFVLAPSSVQIAVLYFALLSIGVVISPANPISSKSEISRQLQLSKPVIAFATSATTSKVPSLRYSTILIDSGEFRAMKRSVLGLKRVEVIQSDPAAILYSSGTTGKFKGVVLTHRNLTSIVEGIRAGSRKRVTPAVTLCMAPHFHVYGILYCLKSVALGETAVVMERFDLRMMMKAVEEFKVTHVAVAPPVVVAMMKDEGMTDDYNLRSLEAFSCGGAPLGKELILKFNDRFPNVFLGQAYGLTETTGGISRASSPEDYRLGSTGRLAASCQVKIVDPDTGVALPPCKQGELWAKGPTIMKGYIGDEEGTIGSLDSDGWFKTGDLCYIDNDGFLFVVDRLKELIKYKGYQVAPAELEELLKSHPEIVDAAVIPYPNEEAGQVPMAFVVRRPQSCLDEAQVMDFIAKQVASYKKIRRVSFTNSIPKNAPGKILRKELVKLALSGPNSKL
ncbi:hypothetical protein GIB67_009272 [Kingdonia uniflora]|uniref:4-coumarate--CoA ligase n=1 Tax=Kingdonia uniflora TaxID=39325 RepID=A0A7J7N2N4_9MAGN|nr:hypothetical protein GIB67_009272 [Kingdonia uniflora]